MFKISTTITLALAFSQICNAASWNRNEKPKYFNISNYNYNSMVKKAHLDLDSTGIWSGYHWPNNVRNIDYRPGNQKLSPLEKWEAVGVDLPKYEIRSMLDPYLRNAETITWGGLCHGYSATAISFPEPKRKIINGVKFYHSDIKALLAVYYDYLLMNKLVSSKYLGKRCDQDLPENLAFAERTSKNCDDINPAVFHLAINHRLAVEKKGLVMDMNSGNEVWNVPVIGFDSEILNNDYPKYKSKAWRTKRILHIKTKVSYLGYQKPENDFEISGLKGQKVKTKTYEYTLELNRHGNIIGGEWFGADRPDFLWISDDIPHPSGEWQLLADLLKEELPEEQLEAPITELPVILY